MSMKVVVTGANGYIGSHVVRELIDRGNEVTAVDVKTDYIDPRAICVQASIFEDNAQIYEQLGRPDLCIHLAWRNGFAHNASSHMEDLSGHCRFIRQMVEGGLPRLAVMGTMHEVGYWEGAITDETPCNPMSMYGIAKNALRQAVLQLQKEMNFSVYWLRAYYILGDDEKNHSVFSKILQMEKEGKEKFPFTSGKNLYDFIQVDELAHMIVSASLQDEITGIINLCTGKPVSLADKVMEFIESKQLHIRPEYGAFPDRAYDSPGTWGDPSKIEQILKNEQ